MRKITLLIALLACSIGFGQTSAAEGWVNPDGDTQKQRVQDSNSQTFEVNHGYTAGASITLPSQQIQDSNGQTFEVNHGYTAGASLFLSSTPKELVATNAGYDRANFSAKTGTINSEQSFAPCSFVNPSETISNGLGMEAVNGWSMADDVDVAANEDFTPETLVFEYLNFNPNMLVDVNVSFYEDAAGLPGALIVTVAGQVPVSQTIIGAAFGRDNIEATIDLSGSGVVLPGGAAGTKYWIGLQGNSSGGDVSFWTAGDTINGLESAFSTDSGVTWDTSTNAFGQAFGVFFDLSGDCAPTGGGGGPCAFGNPSETISNGLGMEAVNGWSMADDVDVAANEDFTPETLVFEYLNFNPNMLVDVNVSFYQDAAGLPGALVVTVAGQVPVSQTIIGAAFGRDNIEATIDLSGSGVVLPGGAAGTKYWIGLQGNSSGGDVSFWTAGDTINGLESAFSTDSGVTWATSTDAFGQAFGVFFDLSGDCATTGGGPTCDVVQFDATGLPFDIDGAGDFTADCTNAPNLVPVTVGDPGTIGVDSNIDNVTITITHTFDGDLDIFLVAPDGTELILSDQNGGGGDDYIDTVFMDGGGPLSGGAPPFTGTFEPDGGTFAAAFNGVDIQGDWQLKVCDNFGGDTGTVDSFSLSICRPEPPSNDECVDAFPIACGDIVVGETITDTDSGGNPANDEWYSFTGSGTTQLVTLSLCDGGTDYDSLLRVFDACGGTEIATNDDACGLQSELNFVSDGTTTYYVMVEGFGANDGNFSLEVTCVDPPPNDECAGALDITCGETVVGETDTATFDATAPVCVTDITAPGVWYTFTDDTGLITNYTLSMCDGATDYDSKITVYSGDCGALACVVDNDDTCGLQSEVAWQGDGSTTYYVLVHGFGGSTGNFSMALTCAPVPPPNDMIVNSIDVDEIGFPYTDPAVAMPAATTEAGNPVDCNIDGANGVWYNFVPDGDGFATATITTPAGASFVNFFSADSESATEDELTLVPFNGNQCAPQTDAIIPTTAGQAYYVFVVNTDGITDIVIDGNNLGADDNAIQGFTYYPNPANDILNLNSIDTIDNVAIYNILGQQVLNDDVAATSGTLNVSNLAVGAYIMKVSVNGEIGTYKIIKR